MSVIFFEATELGHVAKAYAESLPNKPAREAVTMAAQWLARYSVANAAAYRRTYNENPDPVDAAQIRDAAAALGDTDNDRVKLDASLLAYNAVSNGGRDYADPDLAIALEAIHEAIATLPDTPTATDLEREKAATEGRRVPGKLGGQYRDYLGEKCDTDLDIAEIAKRVRAEIRDDIKSGRLPAGLKASVRIERFSGGRALNVNLTAAPFAIHDTARLLAERDTPHDVNSWPREAYTAECRDVLARFKAIAEAYNYDRDDSQSDYFDVHFYLHTGIDWEVDHLAREAAKAALDPPKATAAPDAPAAPTTWDAVADQYDVPPRHHA